MSGICLGAAAALAAKTETVDYRGALDYETMRHAEANGLAVRIKSSPGGTGAAAMALGRTRALVVDGPCNSACAWAFVRNESACFTPRASFGFHGAHDPGTGRPLPAATGYWLSTVGEALRARLEPLRTTSGIIRIKAREMTRYYAKRACPAA